MNSDALCEPTHAIFDKRGEPRAVIIGCLWDPEILRSEGFLDPGILGARNYRVPLGFLVLGIPGILRSEGSWDRGIYRVPFG